VSLLRKIFDSRKSEAAGGAYRWHPPDLILLPDYAVALFADQLDKQTGTFFSKDRLLVTADHFAPPATIERANVLRVVQDLCARQGWDLRLFEGICHQLLVEDPRAKPGALIIGGDSHTVTAGALGCLALGFGSTDIFAALIKGRIAVRIPEVIKVVLTGRLRAWVMGKDVILEIFRRFGHEKLKDRALEFVDRTEDGVHQSDRFCICNMMAEASGKAAMFIPDAVTVDYLRKRDGEDDFEFGQWTSPPEDDYLEEHVMDLDDLEPMTATPHNPFNVVALRDVRGLVVHQVFLGSCNAGRIEDLAVASKILSGKTAAPGLKAIAIPGSKKVYLEALKAGYLQTLIEAGVVIGNPSCGPCGAVDKGLLADGERCAATINRNYRGRMGSPDAQVYLVSPAVAAASMVIGKLTDPRDL